MNLTTFTPYQTVLFLLLRRAVEAGSIELDLNTVSTDMVDAQYQTLLVDTDMYWDFQSELRGGEVETDIPVPYSRATRDYESQSVAAELPDGRWVGWTYWYGGGKHSEPEAIDWMEHAYFLDVKEEEKMVIVRTFTKV